MTKQYNSDEIAKIAKRVVSSDGKIKTRLKGFIFATAKPTDTACIANVEAVIGCKVLFPKNKSYDATAEDFMQSVNDRRIKLEQYRVISIHALNLQKVLGRSFIKDSKDGLVFNLSSITENCTVLNYAYNEVGEFIMPNFIKTYEKFKDAPFVFLNEADVILHALQTSKIV